MGLELMPHQRLVADVGTELIRNESGLWVPAYREVGVTIPRQNGKTVLVLCWLIHRCILWHTLPQKAAYTAQSGSDARKKIIEDYFPLIKASPFNPGVARFYRAAENTGVAWRNGSRISVWNNAESSGHGQTIGLGVMDEIFSDLEPAREQAMGPAMSTVEDAQRLWTSTAGTEESPVYDLKVDAGRSSVDAGATEGIAYFEWSADEDSDPTDPAVWHDCMPALGRTVAVRSIQNELDIMAPPVNGIRDPDKLAEFARAYCNIPNRKSRGRVIAASAWNQVHVDEAKAAGRITFGVDVSPDRSMTAIVAIGTNREAELVAHNPGVVWAKDWLIERCKKHNARVAIDSYSPANSLIQPLEEAGITVVSFNAQRYAAACGSLYDDIYERRIKVYRAKAFDDAVGGANRRPLGDSWAWSRKHSDTDITPLVALTLAADVPRAEPEHWQGWPTFV